MAWGRWSPFSQSRRSWGLLLLGVWLILTGLQGFELIQLANLGKIMAGLAIASGVLIILDR
jgi:hypothetical protein